MFFLIQSFFLSVNLQASASVVDCSLVKKQKITVDGEVLQRYVVTSPDHLRCIRDSRPSGTWAIKKYEWDQEEEILWQKFLASLGASRCRTLDECLSGPNNILRDSWDEQVTHYADCADFPYYLRAYFSFKRGLPFSVVQHMTVNPLKEEQVENLLARYESESQAGRFEQFLKTLTDMRYSLNGNAPQSRVTVPNTNGTGDFFAMIRTIHNVVSTGTYRMLFSNVGRQRPDFYSPQITRTSIKPGTVLYKPTGHAAIIYQVTDKGEIKFLDAHPDNSVTRGVFNQEYVRSNPMHGSGFKNWRPFRWTIEPSGRPQIQFLSDNEIPDFSLEQYFGNRPNRDWDWRKGKFEIRGQEVDFQTFVRIQMAKEGYRVNVLDEWERQLEGLCADFNERTKSVQVAIDAGIFERPHPDSYPINIYGTEGEWEVYSTPGRDLRIRKKILDISELPKKWLLDLERGDPFIEYKGSHLKLDLLRIYDKVNFACVIEYQNSKKERVRLSLTRAIERVTRLAFDPYLCPEKRWGAVSPLEFSSCLTNEDKLAWYQYTEFLRRATIRDPSEVMGYTLQDLKTRHQKYHANEAQNPRFNIRKAVEEL
jgi:hypothetical protein